MIGQVKGILGPREMRDYLLADEPFPAHGSGNVVLAERSDRDWHGKHWDGGEPA